MAVSPSTLRPAAARLYESVQHLEVATDDYSPESEGWPWATLCAALAAPVEDLYAVLALGEVPWAPVFDAETGPDWSLPFLSNFAGVDTEGVTSMAELRARIRERPARKRGSPLALRSAIEEELRRQHVAAGLEVPSAFHVIIYERYGGVATDLHVSTWLAETPDAEDIGGGVFRSAGVGRAALRATRAGLRVGLTTSVIPGGTYETLAATHADYDEVAADFADYDAVLNDPSAT